MNSSSFPTRHALTQCQHCFKSKGENVKLLRCTGCQVDIYCSKECQKAAWPTHKMKCKLNQRLVGDVAEQNKSLRAFTSKHRPTLCQAAYVALILNRFPENAEDLIFFVEVKKRPGATRAELAYTVVNASPVPYSIFPQAGEMQAVRRDADATQKRNGFHGAFMMMLLDKESGVSNVAPVGFKVEEGNDTPIHWKDFLIQRLNGGITF